MRDRRIKKEENHFRGRWSLIQKSRNVLLDLLLCFPKSFKTKAANFTFRHTQSSSFDTEKRAQKKWLKFLFVTDGWNFLTPITLKQRTKLKAENAWIQKKNRMGKKTENQASVAHFSFFSSALPWFRLPLSSYSMKPVFKGELFDTAKNVKHLRLIKDKWGNSLLIISALKQIAWDKQDEFSVFFQFATLCTAWSMEKERKSRYFPNKSFSFYFPQQKVFSSFINWWLLLWCLEEKSIKKQDNFHIVLLNQQQKQKVNFLHYSHSFSFPLWTNAILLYNR